MTALTPLENLLKRRLAEAPITVADYMRLALGHPEHGYYRTRDPLGAADFVTAPEVSQMFGELLGFWCAHLWALIGQPKPVRLVELGPGRGTLMADALRAVKSVVPTFHQAVEIHMVETSPVLRARQRRTLDGETVVWHDDLETVPDGPLLLIANEFLDALPIHQLVKEDGEWYERQVVLAAEDGSFSFGRSEAPSALARLLAPQVQNSPDGTIAEVSPDARSVSTAIARRIKRSGGAAVLVDYGYSRPATGDSLQAIRGHQFHPVLSRPGEADLTAHVDFSAVVSAAMAEGVEVHGPVEQGLFLERLGIHERADRLTRDTDAVTSIGILDGLARLTAQDRMGSLFKVVAFGPRGLKPLPGFVR